MAEKILFSPLENPLFHRRSSGQNVFLMPFAKLFLSLFFALFAFILKAQTSGPRADFERLWQQFDRNYALFDLKKVDWKAVKTEHQTRVSDATSRAALEKLKKGNEASNKKRRANAQSGPYRGSKTVRWSDFFSKFGVKTAFSINRLVATIKLTC